MKFKLLAPLFLDIDYFFTWFFHTLDLSILSNTLFIQLFKRQEYILQSKYQLIGNEFPEVNTQSKSPNNAPLFCLASYFNIRPWSFGWDAGVL